MSHAEFSKRRRNQHGIRLQLFRRHGQRSNECREAVKMVLKQQIGISQDKVPDEIRHRRQDDRNGRDYDEEANDFNDAPQRLKVSAE